MANLGVNRNTCERAVVVTYRVIQKCHDFNRMPIQQLLTETIVLGTYCCQPLSILFDKKFKSNAAIVFSPEEKVEIVLFWLVEEEAVATISPTLRRVWHGIS